MTTTSSPDGSLALEHERFGRVDDPATLRVRIRAGPGPGDVARVAIDRETLDRVRIEGITPEPIRSELGADGVSWVFAARGPAGPATVAVSYMPRRAGLIRGRLSLDDRPPLRFSQFVYP